MWFADTNCQHFIAAVVLVCNKDTQMPPKKYLVTIAHLVSRCEELSREYQTVRYKNCWTQTTNSVIGKGRREEIQTLVDDPAGTLFGALLH